MMEKIQIDSVGTIRLKMENSNSMGNWLRLLEVVILSGAQPTELAPKSQKQQPVANKSVGKWLKLSQLKSLRCLGALPVLRGNPQQSPSLHNGQNDFPIQPCPSCHKQFELQSGKKSRPGCKLQSVKLKIKIPDSAGATTQHSHLRLRPRHQTALDVRFLDAEIIRRDLKHLGGNEFLRRLFHLGLASMRKHSFDLHDGGFLARGLRIGNNLVQGGAQSLEGIKLVIHVQESAGLLAGLTKDILQEGNWMEISLWYNGGYQFNLDADLDLYLAYLSPPFLSRP